MDDEPTFWFPIKRYGWGWGLPVRWQGWVVLIAYGALLLTGVLYSRHSPRSWTFLYVAMLTAVLVVVIAVKGEKPLRWRWGKERRRQ